MSVLTRIKNNQITDSTILANTKIVPGSIVGSLFNTNLTMTSDVTITGNLTVQGSSTYLTVASTNTYVNDPLIVMNNAFTGTNTNDIGLLFNRGSDTNQAFIWDESEDEFRLIATTETGDTYGAVTTSSYANVRVGNLNVEGAAAFGSLSTVNLTLSGDAAVNGGDLTTTATSFNLVNSNATTVNFAGDATTLIIGSTSGTANIRNATINLLGNATVGGTLDVTGHVTLEGVTSTGATGTGNLVFSDSPVLTTPNIGTPSFANLTNATALPISTGVSGLAAGVADFLTTPTSSNLISAVTDETGTGNLVFSTSPVLTTPNIGTPSFANLTNAVALPVSSLVGFASGIADFLTTPTSSNLISAVTDETGTGNLVFSTSPTLETSVVTTSTNFDLLNTTATTLNFAGAATALTIGATSGTANIRNATTGIVGNAVIYSTTPTTYSTEGALQVKGGTGIGGNLVVDGIVAIGQPGAWAGDPDTALYVSAPRVRTIIQSTSDLFASTKYQVIGVPGGFDIGLNDSAGSAFGGAKNAFISASGGPDLVLVATNNSVISEFAIRSSGNIEVNPTYPTSNVSFTIYNTTQSTSTNTGALVVAGGAGIAGNLTAGNLVAGNATITGTLGVTGDSTLTGNLAVNGGDLTTTASTATVFNTTATTVSAFGAATTLGIGAGTGTLTLNNASITTPGQIISTRAGSVTTGNGQIFLNGSTSNRIDWAAVGTGAPAFTTRTDGTKVVLYPALSGSTVDYAIGIDSATMWSSVPENTGSFNFKWYGAETLVANLSGTGNFTTVGDVAVNGGNLTTTAGTFNLIDTNATTVNFAGVATTLTVGATSGTTTIRNNLTNTGNILINATTQSTDKDTGALVVEGGVGIEKNLNVGGEFDVTGNINLDATTPSTDTDSGALIVAGGAGIGGNLFVGGNATIAGNLTVTGNITFTNENNLAVSDAIIELHYPEGGVFTENDGHDVGLRFHWYDGSNDNSFLGRANDTGYLEWYGSGVTEDPNVAVITGEYGSMKLGNILLAGNGVVTSTSTSTGAIVLENERGIGVGGNIWFGGSTLGAGASTVDLINTTATTVNFAGAATALAIGATTGTLTINNPTVVGTQSTQNLYNTTATTVNFAGAATTLTIGAATGTTNIRNALVDIDGNATVGGTLGVTGDTTLTGDIAVNGGDITTTATTVTVFNTNATTVDAFGAATDLEFGATTGTLTINNPTVVGSQTTQDLYNTTATTLNFAGAATTLSIGASSGNTSINNTLDIANTVIISSTGIELANTKITNLQGPTAGADAANKTYVDTALDTFVGTANITLVGTLPNLTVGNLNATSIVSTGTATLGNLTADRINDTVIGDITPAAATFTNVTDQSLTATRVTFAGTGGDLTDSANFTFASNILTVKNFSINGDTAEISVVGGSGNVVLNPDSGGVIDATGSLISNVANPVSAQDVVTLSYLNSELTSNIGALAKGDSDVTVTDSGTGAITANVDATSVLSITSSSASFYSGFVNIDNATTNVAITGTAYISSTATVNGNLNVNGITTLNDSVSVTDTTSSTAYDNGALRVSGGLGVAGNLHIASTSQLVVGSEIASNIILANMGAAFFGNVDSAYKIAVQNTSSNVFARSELQIDANNSTDDDEIQIRFGITSSTFNDPTNAIFAPNDGYVYTTEGNQLVGSVNGDVVIFVGGRAVEDELVRFSNDNSNVTILSNVISTSSTTGALTVRGGVGFGANLNVSSGTVINVDQTAEPFQVKGQFATTLIYADSATGTVTIGGSNTTPVSGATLRVNGTGALILPVGTTSQRPGSSGNIDVPGMMRINSSLNILEYYDGTAWQSSQGSFTIISSESFNGDGANVAFEMTGAGSTASTIVAINGIVQIPVTSYSVSDTTLTFTEPPEIGDIIDVRRLTTTVSVDELSFNQNVFKANLDYALISTGTVSPIPRLLIGTDGLVTITSDMEIYGNLTVKGSTNGQINIGDSDTDNVAITAEINSNLVPNANNTYDLGSSTQRWKNVYSHATVHDQTPVNVSANATPVLVDSFLTSEYSSAKYLVQVKDGSNIQVAEILLIQDSTNAYITTYGVLSSFSELGGFTANVSSGNVNVYYTSTTATNSNVKVHSTYIV